MKYIVLGQDQPVSWTPKLKAYYPSLNQATLFNSLAEAENWIKRVNRSYAERDIPISTDHAPDEENDSYDCKNKDMGYRYGGYRIIEVIE